MNYRTLIATACAATALLFAPTVWAEDNESEQANAQDSKMKELVADGSGVKKTKYDENNTLTSCVIVGCARISMALGKAKGLIDARKQAKLNAEAEFVGWIKKNVTDINQNCEMTTRVITGADAEGNSIESGVSTNTSSQVTTSKAQGQLRGMRLLGSYQDSEEQMMYMIYAWKPAYAAAAAGVAGAMNTADAAPGKAAPTGIGSENDSGSSGSGSSGSSNAPKAKYKTKGHLDKDADEFL